MRHRVLGLIWTFVFFAATASVYAQGASTASLSGIVIDPSGAVLPGADATVKNNGTGTTFTAVTGPTGVFTVPALDAGSYTVTISMMGFKTVNLADVRVNAATPASVRVTLEVGELAETITVQGQSSEIVQTRTAAVQTTLDINQISNLPLTSRNAFEFVTFLPGVQTAAGARDSIINGLPQSAINLTIDGMSAADNYNKSTDGFYARLNPRLDAVEEVTVTTAANDADASGQGAVQVRFVTRSGSNKFSGGLFHYYRNDGLNANTWFNNRNLPADPRTGKAPKTELLLNQAGFRAGGPIVIPGLWDGHNKGFFFMMYEHTRQPQKVTRDRTVLHPLAQQGMFRYSTPSGVQQVNLLQLAAANGQIATLDPQVSRLLADIQSATSTTGQFQDLTDPLIRRYTFQLPSSGINHYPTGRVDFNLTDKHRLTGSFNYQKINSTPDLTNNAEPRFPGFPITGSQQSTRYSTSNWLRSTLSSSMVNELRVGGTGGATFFSPELNPSLWGGSMASQGGMYLNINNACCSTGLTAAGVAGGQSSREASTKVVEDTLNWLKGAHNFSFGASYVQADVWLQNQLLVPEIRFGLPTGDPAISMFTPANFPGASTTNLNNARGLYSMLVGRVLEIRGIARLNEDNNQYEYLGSGLQRGRLRDLGFFAQDSWQIRPNLTLNVGLRYALQLPFYALNSSYTAGTIEDIWGVSGVGNLFKPGTLTGQPPTFEQYKEGTRGYNIDWNNLAPSLNLVWAPPVTGGVLGKVLGAESDSVFRVGGNIAYERPGMADFTGVFGDNPGVAINVNRDQTLGNLGAQPLLLRDTGRLGPPAFNSSPVYPLSEVITGDMEIFDPNIQVPYSITYTGGWQRKITHNSAFEIRYVGARHLQGWSLYDFNEVNIVENGFLREFRLAQQNLQANIAGGRGNNFRYFGPGTGTVPLPIFLAYFNGSADANNAAAYTSGSFADNAFLQRLAIFNPNPQQMADDLDADSNRIANALRAGLPANFLVANPDLLGGAEVMSNSGYTKYNGLQTEFRKRLSGGLQVYANYSFGNAYESARYSLRTPRRKRLNTGAEGSVRQAFRGTWVYELPFGAGRRFASGANGLLGRLVGGWTFDGTMKLQNGRELDLGNVRLVGMDRDELRREFKLRFDDAGRAVYMLPDDIVVNTVKAWNVSATSASGYGTLGPPSGRYIAPANGPDCIEIAEGYGDCGIRTVTVTGPMLQNFDLSIGKRTRLVGDVTLDFRAEMLNAFNHPWFTPVTGNNNTTAATQLAQPNYNNPDQFRVTGLSGADTSRIVQLVTRISW